ncbi:MAG TPA: DNA-binding domain-containing protein [Luteibacter sp.]|jgi:hypothetical protein|nr:DNA-binding domain-containing protein [Luteibacter sp.]
MMLIELQRDFRAWLVSASDDAAMRLADGELAGLSVYQNNYRAQLVGCLEQAFPHTRTWMGEEAFLTAAITHIDNRPPHAWTLDAYAAGFDDTLATLFPERPDLHELAWIEFALAEAFVAPDAGPLSAETLASIDWDSARLRLTPSFMSLVATTNAESIWSALWEGSAAPEGEMLDEAAGLIVWRRGFVSCLRRVDALESDALLQLRRDGSFASLCEMLVERLGDTDGIARAGALLAHWLGSELIVGVDEA